MWHRWNCGGGRNRSASAHRIRANHVRHGTCLSRRLRVSGTAPVRQVAPTEIDVVVQIEAHLPADSGPPLFVNAPVPPDLREFGYWTCAPWGTGGTVEVVEIGALLPTESPPVMFDTAPVSPDLREFGHSTCPPGGTSGNFEDGRDRSASPCRIRATHVRQSTRLGGSSCCCGAGTTRSLCRVRDSSALVVYATPVTTRTAEKGRLFPDGREVVCFQMAGRSSVSRWPGGRLFPDGREVVCFQMAGRSSVSRWPGGRLLADGREVVCLRMARRSSACGWPGGRLFPDGRRLLADGWEVVCLRMAARSADGRRSSADGRRSSACGRPEVVCVRTAGNNRSSTDGPLRGRPRVARGRLRMACSRFTVPGRSSR